MGNLKRQDSATMFRLSLLVALLLVACSGPPAPSPGTSASTTPASVTTVSDQAVEFQLASGNTGCDYVPAGGTETYTTPDGGPQLICDRIEPSYVRFTLSAHGAATLIRHVGDAGCCGGDTVQAGAHWTGGPFACDISEEGVRCANADQQGFVLSRTEARAS